MLQEPSLPFQFAFSPTTMLKLVLLMGGLVLHPVDVLTV